MCFRCQYKELALLLAKVLSQIPEDLVMDESGGKQIICHGTFFGWGHSAHMYTSRFRKEVCVGVCKALHAFKTRLFRIDVVEHASLRPHLLQQIVAGWLQEINSNLARHSHLGADSEYPPDDCPVANRAPAFGEVPDCYSCDSSTHDAEVCLCSHRCKDLQSVPNNRKRNSGTEASYKTILLRHF